MNKRQGINQEDLFVEAIIFISNILYIYYFKLGCSILAKTLKCNFKLTKGVISYHWLYLVKNLLVSPDKEILTLGTCTKQLPEITELE